MSARVLVWLAVFGLLLPVAAFAQEEELGEELGAPAVGVPGKVIYEFADEAEMTEFEQMYQAKQIIGTRIAVLQGYLAQERANLDQIDAQMYLKYKFTLEPNKRYDLNRDTMILRELE